MFLEQINKPLGLERSIAGKGKIQPNQSELILTIDQEEEVKRQIALLASSSSENSQDSEKIPIPKKPINKFVKEVDNAELESFIRERNLVIRGILPCFILLETEKRLKQDTIFEGKILF